MIRAVIFDFDGVVGDTMTDNCVAWQKSFERYGFQLSAAEYYRMEGMGRYQIAKRIIDEHRLEIKDVDDIVEFKETYYKNNNTFRLYDGVREIFAFLLEKRVPAAIVTGASRARIGEHLDKEIRQELAALITADDVTHTKPHPEPYLSAVWHLGERAENCLVIENAILGIESAKAAGCQCFALETTLGRADLAIADEVIGTHLELLARLQQLLP